MIEALIVAIVITMAVKYAAEHASGHWQKSKAGNRKSTRGKSIPKRAASAVHHDVGYWAHQVLNGFPEVRRGLADGWHEGRAAQAQGTAERHRRKTERLEGRAGLAEQIREHRRRQAEARERIRAAAEPEPGPELEPEPEPEPSREPEPEPERPVDRTGLPVCPRCQAPTATPELCPVCRLYDSRNGQQEPEENTVTKEGTSMASDVTYDGVLRHVTLAQDFEEAALAERNDRAGQAAGLADQMQALGVDPATLGAMGDYLDAMADAQKAQQQAMEAAEVVAVNLKRGHAALSEAHKEAPVRAAERPFYEE